MPREVVIIGGARTPMAEYVGTPGGGAFKDLSALELGGIAGRAALERARVKPEEIQHVIFGNALQTSGDAAYGARHAALRAGIPVEVPALTVNRLCGSGLQSVVSAAQLIQLGEAERVLAGGMENMSQAPHVLWGARSGFRLGQPAALQDLLMVALLDTQCGLYMAQTADNCARKYGITRAAQDEYALRSHREGVRAVRGGVFKEEIVPVSLKGKKETVQFENDDHIKPDTSIEALAKLSPAFGKDCTVTAGNASGIVDGAAAVVVTSAEHAKARGANVLARVVSWGIVGVAPDMMGIGPVPAIRQALDRAGLRLDQVDLFEINEAFAAQYLSVEKELELDRRKVNVNGGAIAIGHPLGATGTRIILTLALELKRRGLRTGVASACIGGGQGIAVVLAA